MTSENIEPFAGRPAPQLMPGQRLRDRYLPLTGERWLWVKALEATFALEHPSLPIEETEREAILALRARLFRYLLPEIDLVGLEWCDEVAERIGVIQGVSEAAEDADFPFEPWVHLDPDDESLSMRSLIDLLSCSHFVRLPDSSALYDYAMLEALRARIGEAAQ